MTKILLISMSIIVQLGAQNLTEILESLHSSNKAQMIQEKAKVQRLQSQDLNYYDAPSLFGSYAHVDTATENGAEYAIGISQSIVNPLGTTSKKRAVTNAVNAINQEAKHELHILTLNAISHYYRSCVSKEMHETSSSLYEEQLKRYKQIQKAYELGEISKKDLLFNKLDLVKLKKNISAFKRMYLNDFSNLQSMLDSIELTTLSCTDVQKPSSHVALNPIEEHGEIRVLEYKKNESASLYKLSSASMQEIGYELVYEKERDVSRYTVGLSIPLGGFTSQKESVAAQHLGMLQSYTYEQEAKKSEIEKYTESSLAKLFVMNEELDVFKNEILPVNKELVVLSQSALDAGEGNVMEYLDATRSYALNLLEMLKIKKDYYKELFELYKVADLDYGEAK
ncbi:TolC family protein [Sulfurimonas sp. SAG-AH-194-I05]|nr:TolC family protein [Sulfurimonas sp. SAG-AH-194-I05]MDF1874975.1 TolC family protein [Sulfurimonas sp. SAG-AH-194-I05]